MAGGVCVCVCSSSWLTWTTPHPPTTSWQVFDMWGTVMLTKPDTTAYGLGWAWDGT